MQTMNLLKRKGALAAILLLLSVTAHFSLHAQMIIGTTEEFPKVGALLDLNSTNGTKGGLLLSNVAIDDLELIPTGTDLFPGIDATNNDTNKDLRGAMVYNSGTATVPRGVYIWNGEYWTTDGSAPYLNEKILFTVRAADGTYIIPTSGRVSDVFHTYDWNVSIDGGAPSRYFITQAPDISDLTNADAGILLSSLTPGDHQIEITPYDNVKPGWGNAFGHSYAGGGVTFTGANTDANKQKLISIDAPLTTRAFAPDAGNASAAYMFAHLFASCTSLTDPATFLDTYKLPGTVTDLSSFLALMHIGNTSLQAPVDLSPLKKWFNNNTSITNLSFFFYATHFENSSLQVSIDLAPVQEWFSNNTSIENLSYFLCGTHLRSANVAPVDLSPLSGWFKGNTSINDLSCFLRSIYLSCPNLLTPIDITPLSGWFDANTSISNLASFLYEAHCGNLALKLEGQKIFPNWIKTLKQGAIPILNVPEAFYYSFGCTASQAGDTEEPKFEDGTVLSSIGEPNSARGTYTHRTGITPLNNTNNYWK
jgi:hypothetical protein